MNELKNTHSEDEGLRTTHMKILRVIVLCLILIMGLSACETLRSISGDEDYRRLKEVGMEKPCNPNKDPECSKKPPIPDDEICTAHSDNDRICDDEDNCPTVDNPYDVDTDGDGQYDAQLNTDGDGDGDACDTDMDNDGVDDKDANLNPIPVSVGGDNCPRVPNANQSDIDCDGVGDKCDQDMDGDGISNQNEYLMGTLPDHADFDKDGISDGDLIPEDCHNLYVPPITKAGDQTPFGDKKYIQFVAIYVDADCDGISDNLINRMDTWLPVPPGYVTAKFQADDPPSWVQSRCIRIQARLYDPVNKSYVPFENDVTFSLNPTREQGIATNHSEVCPRPDCPIDFSFKNSQNQSLSDVLNKTVVASGQDKVSLSVYAFDYGGFFTITAKTPVTGGYDAKGKATLPKDSDNDGLPDIIEKHYGFNETDPYALDPLKITPDGGMDVDKLKYNAFAGDGLTNYREWRGIVYDAQGTIHERLNPKKKNLFVRGDFYKNSVCSPSSNPDVLDFSLKVTTDPVNNPDQRNAFETAGIDVHDVTGYGYFCQEAPNIDVLVVTNKALVDGQPFNTLNGQKDGYIKHPSPNYPRHWLWEVKGASFIGTPGAYALNQITGEQGTETYHASLMNYIYNRPYVNDMSPAWLDKNQNICLYNAADSPSKLDPLDHVEDFIIENGIGPDKDGKITEDRCVVNKRMDGDRINHPAWISKIWDTDESKPYKAGFHFSVFDADADGFVELPVVEMPADVMALDPKNFDPKYEYYSIQVQTQTIVHEMGHGLGVSKNHVADQTCVMYVPVKDWSHAGHVCPEAIGQFFIHNQ